MIGATLQFAAGLAATVYALRAANNNRPGMGSLMDMLGIGIIGTVGIMAVLAVPISRAPVVLQAHAEIVSREPGRLRVHMMAYKPDNKRGCTYLPPTDAYVISPAGALEVQMAEEADPQPGNTRPPGQIDFGVWAVTYPPALQISGVMFRARHQCAWWLPITSTDMGPFPVPPSAG